VPALLLRFPPQAMSDNLSEASRLFHRVGGAATFDALVRAFYDGVMDDPDLAPMYPSEDIEGAIWRLSHFLQQYFGGPTTYSEQRGHPRLRMRHAAFAINPHAKERWLVHMRSAVTTLNLAPMDESELSNYLESAALSMVNTFEA